MVGSSKDDAISIKVDGRSATRQAVITRLKQKGYALLERSSRGATPPTSTLTPSHWDYRDIAIHHASLWQNLKGSMDIAKGAVAFDHAMPTKEQIDGLSALIETLKEFFNITASGGHREYQLLAPGNEGRACPGKYGMQVVEEMRAKFGLGAPSK